MTLTAAPATVETALHALRRLRARQAVTLMAVAAVSIITGTLLFFFEGSHKPFWTAVAWQFVTWGAIDAAFAGLGVAQSVRVTGRPPSPQAEADEFAAAEKLLGTLHFNGKLNWFWLACGAALLAWAAAAHSLPLGGHGFGVVVQGGFLFAFDNLYSRRFERLLYAST